jgi:glutaredoxin
MPPRIILFTQPGCMACEIVKMFLEVREIVFEECDIGDPQLHSELRDVYHAHSAPTVVILTAAGPEVIEGFDPDRIDRCLSPA